MWLGTASPAKLSIAALRPHQCRPKPKLLLASCFGFGAQGDSFWCLVDQVMPGIEPGSPVCKIFAQPPELFLSRGFSLSPHSTPQRQGPTLHTGFGWADCFTLLEGSEIPMSVAPVKGLYVAAHRLSWACAQLSGTHPGCSAQEDFLQVLYLCTPHNPCTPELVWQSAWLRSFQCPLVTKGSIVSWACRYLRRKKDAPMQESWSQAPTGTVGFCRTPRAQPSIRKALEF